MASTIPIVANTIKTTMREISTVSPTSIGLPSYGMPPIYYYRKNNFFIITALLFHGCPLNVKLSTAASLISAVPILSLLTVKPTSSFNINNTIKSRV